MHRTLPEQCLLKRGVSDQGLFELQYSHILLEVKNDLYDAMEFQKPCQMPLQIYLVQFQSFVLLPLALLLEGLIRKQQFFLDSTKFSWNSFEIGRASCRERV